MKEFYTAPSASVYTLTSRETLANDVAFDDLLGGSSKQEGNASIVSSDIDITLRD